MAHIIYGLCALTAFLCAVLLLQGYRRSRYNLLLWGGLCFCILTVNNVLLVIDKVLLPYQVDLSMARLTTALLAMMVFLYGLIFEKERK